MKLSQIAKMIILGSALSSCVWPPGLVREKHQENDVAEIQSKAEVEFTDKKVNIFLGIEIDGQYISGRVAHLEPGHHQVIITNYIQGVTGAARSVAFGVAATPCAVGVAAPIYPLIFGVAACPAAMALEPKSKCNVITWDMRVEANQKYHVEVDWSAEQATVVMKNVTDDQLENISTSCKVIEETGATSGEILNATRIPGH
jgi:hypothetical protein